MSNLEILDKIESFIRLYKEKEEGLQKIFLHNIKSLMNKELTKSQVITPLLKILIQYIFKHNLIIIKEKNTIRHSFPSNFEESDEFKSKLDMFTFLSELIELSDLNITILKAQDGSYFSVSDYFSIINIIFCWQNPILDLEPKKKNDIKEIFRKSHVLVFFKKKFINRIFGEGGLLQNKNLSIPQFIEKVSISKKYSRQSVHNWKRDNYLPIGFLDLLIKAYNEFIDFFQHIDYVQIGKIKKSKQSKILSSEVLQKIRSEIDWFKDFIPMGSTNFGRIFQQTDTLQDQRNINQILVKKYKDQIREEFLPETIKKYQKDIDWVISNLIKPQKSLVISSLKLRNFRSYNSVTLNFEHGINIFYGLNGSGKTTIIEAILFALLRLHPLHSLTYIPTPSESRSPLYIFILNTWLIQFGKDECEVELILKRDDEYIKIRRKIRKSGYQELEVNERNLLDLKVLGVGQGFIGTKEHNVVLENLKDDSQLDPMTSSFSTEIFEKYEELGVLVEKDEIFTSFYTDFLLFWNWENELVKSYDISSFYTNKFRLNWIYLFIENLKQNKNEKLINKALEIFKISLKLSPLNLYDEINKNKWFKIYSGVCYNCEERLSQLEEELYDSEYPYDMEKRIKIDYDIQREYGGGLVCQNCGEYFCYRCNEHLTYCNSEDCGGKFGDESYLPWRIYDRRAYKPYSFFDLIEESNKFESFIKEIRMSDPDLSPYLRDIFLGHVIEHDIKSIKRFVENNSNLEWLSGFKIEINKQARERLEISKDIIDVNFAYIFKIFKKLVIISNKDKQKENTLNDIVLDIKRLVQIQELSEDFRILDIITYFSLLLIYNFIKINDDIRGSKSTVSNNLYTILHNSRNRIKSKFNQFIKIKQKSIFEQVLEYKEEIFGFEEKLYRLLYYIYSLTNSSLFPEKVRAIIAKNEFSEDFLSYLDLSKAFIRPALEIVDQPTDLDWEEIIYSKDYNFEQTHELDYKILRTQISTQIEILNEIDKHNNKRNQINNEIDEIENRLNFLYKNADFLRKLYLNYLSEEIEKKSKLIFKNRSFSSYIDEEGIPRIRFHKKQGSASILILSSGEKSKLFLAILGTLITLSNRNQFILIDEPNEFLDPNNINIMKEYLSGIFKNKQLIICTFIEKYKKFQPAVIYELIKRYDDTTEIERIQY